MEVPFLVAEGKSLRFHFRLLVCLRRRRRLAFGGNRPLAVLCRTRLLLGIAGLPGLPGLVRCGQTFLGRLFLADRNDIVVVPAEVTVTEAAVQPLKTTVNPTIRLVTVLRNDGAKPLARLP